MGLFDSWFGRIDEKEKQPNIKFGRYSDSYKTDQQYTAWQDSLDKFDDGDHFEAYGDFFDYLGDPEKENVIYQKLGDTHLDFEFFQGSKKIKGYSDGRKFRAEAKVVKASQTNVGFMRRLLEKNFELKYSRFALDANNNVVIVFDTYLLDGSPQKLYYALNELATQSDKMDDLLIDEFNMLSPIETEHIKLIPDEEKEAKYNYITTTIKDVMDRVEHGKLDANIYPQAIGYMLLDLIYKLDYLVCPEGFMMELFERMNRDYFQEDGKSIIEKNNIFKKELINLVARPKQKFFAEMYGTLSTFGLTQVVNHEKFRGFVDEVIKEYDWYAKNKHYDVAMAITGYIVGYCLFYWAVPRPDRELLHLYYEIIESDYFKSLGFDHDFMENDKFNKSTIKKEIQQIIKSNKNKYEGLVADTTLLVYDSKHEFARSFLTMMKEMDVNPRN